MKTTKTILKLTTLMMLVAAPEAPAAGTTDEYHFTKIAESTATETPIAGALNNHGHVAYIAYHLEDFSPVAVRVGNGKTTTDILTPTTGAYVEIGGINDHGHVGLRVAEFDPLTFNTIMDQAIVARRGRLTVLAETQPNVDGRTVGAPAVNNVGTVAFQFDRVGLFQNSILTGRKAPFTAAAEAGPTQWVYGRALNNRNAVAYWRQSDVQGDPASDGLYIWRNGSATRVFDARSQPGEAAGPGIMHSFALNDRGSVAVETFLRRCPFGPNGPCSLYPSRIVRVDQGTITTIATSTETFFASAPIGLNNRGEVMFLGSDDQGNFAVHVGDGVRTRRVLGTGDVLLDKTVAFAFGVGLNARGQVAATVQFSDDSSAVILATPSAENCRFGDH